MKYCQAFNVPVRDTQQSDMRKSMIPDLLLPCLVLSSCISHSFVTMCICFYAAPAALPAKSSLRAMNTLYLSLSLSPSLSVCVYIYIYHVHVYMHICICVYIYIYVFTPIYIYVYIHIYIYIYICICVYRHVYVVRLIYTCCSAPCSLTYTCCPTCQAVDLTVFVFRATWT